jgi:hypothetical protein
MTDTDTDIATYIGVAVLVVALVLFWAGAS